MRGKAREDERKRERERERERERMKNICTLPFILRPALQYCILIVVII